MKQTLESVEAIYEDGAFRPTSPIDAQLAEGQHVHLSVRVDAPASEVDPLAMLTDFWEGLSEDDVREIESIILDRDNWHTRTELS